MQELRLDPAINDALGNRSVRICHEIQASICKRKESGILRTRHNDKARRATNDTIDGTHSSHLLIVLVERSHISRILVVVNNVLVIPPKELESGY
jgi:hypothetical protein